MTLLSLLGLLALLARPAAASPVAFAALCKAALSRAPVLGEASAESRRADWESSRAAAGLLPRVEASAQSDGWASTGQTSPLFLTRPGHEDSWELRAEQTVFAGGRVVNRYRESRGQARSAHLDEAGRRQALLHEVGALSLRWLEADEAVRQADAELARRSGHRDAIGKRRAAGDVPESDLLRAEAEVRRAESEKIEAERARLELRSRLETLTGLDLSAGVAPPPALPLPRDERRGLAEAAAAGSPDVLAGRERAAAAETGLAAQRGDFLPSVVIGGAYRGMREAPVAFDYVPHETLGFVQARWSLFSGGSSRAAVGAARAQAEAASERARRSQDDRALDAELAFDAAKAADGAIAAEVSRRESAAAAYGKVEKRYAAGFDPYLNLLDAAAALKDAEAAVSRARYARERAVLDLYLALGRVDGSALGF